MELYSFTKKNEIIPFTSNWVELKRTSMCSKSSQTRQKDRSHMLSPLCAISICMIGLGYNDMNYEGRKYK